MRLPAEITDAIDSLILALDWDGRKPFRTLAADAQKAAQDVREALEAAIVRYTDAGASEAAEDAAIRALLDDDGDDW
jgi:hypothetical protein